MKNFSNYVRMYQFKWLNKMHTQIRRIFLYSWFVLDNQFYIIFDVK